MNAPYIGYSISAIKSYSGLARQSGNAHAEHTKEISRKVLKLYDLSLDEQSYIETNFT